MDCMRTTPLSQTLLVVTLLCAATAYADNHLGLPSADPETVGMSPEKLAEIPTKLQPLLDEKKTPGFITVVAREGKVVHFEAFGSMDLEREKPMRPDAIFRMYSMTKPITAVAVMILVDEGQLRVSDPVSKYLPEFADMKVLVVEENGTTRMTPADRPITIEHLLTHTAGLTYHFLKTPVSKIYAENGFGSAAFNNLTLEEFSKEVAEMPLLAQPGTEWNYGVAIDILGRVIEVIADQSLGDFLQERIFDPLDMKDSGFFVPDDQIERFAANYEPKADGGMQLVDDPATSRYRKPPTFYSGGGGMLSTAADYLRFAQMLLNGGELDGARIISEESAAAMTTNQLGPDYGESPLATLVPFGIRGVGFGYGGAAVMDGFERTMFGAPGQYGWGGMASTDFWIDKRNNIVGVVLTQLMPNGTYPIRGLMHRATYEAVAEQNE